MTATEESSTGRLAWRRVHILLASLVLIGTAFLVWRPPLWGSHDPIPTTLSADACFLLVGLTLAFALVRFASRAGLVGRSLLYLLTVVFGGMAASRMVLEVRDRTATAFWPPKAAPARAVVLDSLAPRDAAEWGLRVAMHAAGEQTDTLPDIPVNWRFPHQVQLAIGTAASGESEFWSRAGTGANAVACHAVVSGSSKATSKQLTPSCMRADSAPATLVFSTTHRSGPDSGRVSSDSALSPWPQHRFNARRHASVASPDGGPAAHPWMTATHTEVRASSSVVGDMVLVGGHNTGLMAALDVTTGAVRWISRVPNWVHQAPVSDGRIGVVGFGDNERSFWGRAPSGVGGFDVRTGRRLWTRFDESSVMTSPVIIDSSLIYASAAGVLRKRRLATGELLAERELPGGLVMGPPLLVGDTVVVGLEPDHVCAVLAGDLRTLWCHTFAGQQMLGHASPSVDGGIVIASGISTAITPTLRDFLALPIGLQLRGIGAILFPRYWKEFWPGQLFSGLELATGRVVWTSPLFRERREITGHSAGTATTQHGLGVIILPLADTLVVFDTRSGAVRWSSGALSARGTPQIIDDAVIVAGRAGVIEVRKLEDGTLVCSIKRRVGYDRAGPIEVGGKAIFVNLDGEVEAIPAAQLTSCTAEHAQRPAVP